MWTLSTDYRKPPRVTENRSNFWKRRNKKVKKKNPENVQNLLPWPIYYILKFILYTKISKSKFLEFQQCSIFPLIVHRMCSTESFSIRKVFCAEINAFQGHHLFFRNHRLRIKILMYPPPQLQQVCEQCFPEEIRQKAFKSHINPKLCFIVLLVLLWGQF